MTVTQISRKLAADRFFFFNDTATTEIYTLSLHDALPIYDADHGRTVGRSDGWTVKPSFRAIVGTKLRDRKSTRLNSSHSQISYAVFCLKKKKKWYLENEKTFTQLCRKPCAARPLYAIRGE